MIEKPISELIDDYVAGRISTDAKACLEELAAGDPDVRSQLDAAKEAYDFLERAYYWDVKKKLQAFDQSVEVKGDLESNKMMLIMFAGAIIVAILWMISWWYYQPENMAKRYYHPLAHEKKKADDTDSVFQLRIIAEKNFLNKDFVKAGISFQMIITQSEDADRMYAEWNHLLCQLATDGLTRDIRYSLDDFLNLSDEPLKGKAMELKKQLNSWIYKITFFQFSPELSSLKPRLI